MRSRICAEARCNRVSDECCFCPYNLYFNQPTKKPWFGLLYPKIYTKRRILQIEIPNIITKIVCSLKMLIKGITIPVRTTKLAPANLRNLCLSSKLILKYFSMKFNCSYVECSVLIVLDTVTNKLPRYINLCSRFKSKLLYPQCERRQDLSVPIRI